MFTMDRELRFFRTKIKKWECMFFRLRGRGRFFFCMWMEEECFGEWESEYDKEEETPIKEKEKERNKEEEKEKEKS